MPGSQQEPSVKGGSSSLAQPAGRSMLTSRTSVDKALTGHAAQQRLEVAWAAQESSWHCPSPGSGQKDPPSSRAPSMRSGYHAQLQTSTVGLRQEVQTGPCTDTQPRPQAPGSACTAR